MTHEQSVAIFEAIEGMKISDPLRHTLQCALRLLRHDIGESIRDKLPLCHEANCLEDSLIDLALLEATRELTSDGHTLTGIPFQLSEDEIKRGVSYE